MAKRTRKPQVDFPPDQMTTGCERIHFRPMSLDDLPLMHRWVNAAHVREWWDALPTLDAVAAKYTLRILGKEPTRAFIVEVDAKSVGYIQADRIADYPDYARHLGADDGAAGVRAEVTDDKIAMIKPMVAAGDGVFGGLHIRFESTEVFTLSWQADVPRVRCYLARRQNKRSLDASRRAER